MKRCLILGKWNSKNPSFLISRTKHISNLGTPCGLHQREIKKKILVSFQLKSILSGAVDFICFFRLCQNLLSTSA